MMKTIMNENEQSNYFLDIIVRIFNFITAGIVLVIAIPALFLAFVVWVICLPFLLIKNAVDKHKEKKKKERNVISNIL